MVLSNIANNPNYDAEVARCGDKHGSSVRQWGDPSRNIYFCNYCGHRCEPPVSKLTLSNNSTLPQCVEMVDAVGSCKKDNSKPVHRFGGLRMNKKLKELARVLIENGQNWLCFVSGEDEDVILHLEDYFYEEGYKFTIHEVNFVCYEMKKRMGVF